MFCFRSVFFLLYLPSDFVLRNWIQKHSLEREKIKATLWQNLQFWFRNGQKLCVRWSFLYLVLFFPMTTKKFCQERKMLLSSNIRLLVFFLWSNVSGLPCLNILIKILRFFFTNYATCPLLSLFCPWLSLVCPCLSVVCPSLSLVSSRMSLIHLVSRFINNILTVGPRQLLVYVWTMSEKLSIKRKI